MLTILTQGSNESWEIGGNLIWAIPNVEYVGNLFVKFVQQGWESQKKMLWSGN